MKKIVLLCSLLLSMTINAEPNVKLVTDHGFIVENTATTSVPTDLVWQALVEDIDLWWPKDHSWWGKAGTFTIEPKAGGCFCEVAGGKSAVHMQISFVDPNKLFRMTGGLGPLQGMGMHGALDWAFTQQNEQTKVMLTYRVSGVHTEGFEALAEIVAKVQGMQLAALIHYVEQKSK